MVETDSLVSVISRSVHALWIYLPSRDIFPEASITLEVCEKHTFGYKYYRSRGYTVSDAQDRAETTTGASFYISRLLCYELITHYQRLRIPRGAMDGQTDPAHSGNGNTNIDG